MFVLSVICSVNISLLYCQVIPTAATDNYKLVEELIDRILI